MGLVQLIAENRISKWVNEHIIAWIKQNKFTTAFIILIVLALTPFLFLKFMNSVLATPLNCDNPFCHPSMDAYAKAFLQSKHGQQNFKYMCMECHGPPGLGPLPKEFGDLYEHIIASPLLIKQIQGKYPPPAFEPANPKPHIPNERCLRCHAPDAKGEKVFPLTEDNMKFPFDVRDKFRAALENPEEEECKACHSYITHPQDGKLIPTDKGRKYNFTHPGFPNMDLGEWKQVHWRAVVYGEPITVNGVERKVNKGVCEVCHTGELSPESLAEKSAECYGCHRYKEWKTVEDIKEKFKGVSHE